MRKSLALAAIFAALGVATVATPALATDSGPVVTVSQTTGLQQGSVVTVGLTGFLAQVGQQVTIEQCLPGGQIGVEDTECSTFNDVSVVIDSTGAASTSFTILSDYLGQPEYGPCQGLPSMPTTCYIGVYSGGFAQGDTQPVASAPIDSPTEILQPDPAVLHVAKTKDSIKLSWAPPNDFGDPITSYNLTRSGLGADEQTFVQKHLPAGATSASLNHLLPKTRYKITLEAYNSYGKGDGGISAHTAFATVTTLPESSGRPKAVAVSVSVSDASVAQGASINVKGTVHPAKATTVEVQQLRRGRWISTAGHIQHGRYAVAIKPTLSTTRVRVTVPSVKGYESAVSRVIQIHVHAKHH